MTLAWNERPGQNFLNTTAEVIPAYACMELDYFAESSLSANELPTDSQDLQWRVKKPTSAAVTDAGRVVFNGPTPVEANSRGVFAVSDLILAAFDDTDGTPTVGGTVGPKSGSWYLTTAASLYLFRSLDSGQALYESSSKRSIWVEKVGGGGGSTKMIGTMKEAWSSGVAECDIKSMDGMTVTDTGIDADVYDPLGVFALLTTGANMYITYQGGKYYASDNAPCPAE